MREIEFRGKRIDNGEFIYGDLLQINDRTYIHPDHQGDLEDIDFGYSFIEVIPESVGQFTGYRDKNKEKIYEKDIVKYTVTHTEKKGNIFFAEVFFCNGSSHSEWKLKKGKWHTALAYNRIFNSKIEKVGNKIDNSELIK